MGVKGGLSLSIALLTPLEENDWENLINRNKNISAT